MAYEKRLCILKQLKNGFTADGGPLSGAVYAERMNGELVLTPRIAGIAPVQNGRYALAVQVEKAEYCLELKGNAALRVPSSPPLKDGFAVLLCFVRNAGDVEAIAYGYCGKASHLPESLLSVFDGGCVSKKRDAPFVPPMPASPFEQPIPTNPQAPRAPMPVLPGNGEEPLPDGEDGSEQTAFSEAIGYDDEAIAEGNYFSQQLPECDENAADLETQGENAGRPSADGAIHPFRPVRGGLTYYNKIKDRLDAAMKKYPRDDRLNAVFPYSDWVRTENALLGIIYAEGIPRYLCVAVENEDSPPAALQDVCVFVPKSYFNEGDGFYIVFQDAETGEYVRTMEA